MNRRRFLLTSAGIFVPTIVRGINPVMISKVNGSTRLPNLIFNTTSTGTFNPTLTNSGLAPAWDYGDGTATEQTNTPSHAYTRTGTKTVKLFCRDSVSKITRFNMFGQSLSGRCPYWNQFTAVDQIQVYNNGFTGPLPSVVGLSQMTLCHFGINSFSGNVGNYSSNTLLNYLSLHTNQLTSYTSQTVLLVLVYLYLQNNLLTQAAVDQIAADFVVNLAGRPAVGALNVGGTGNSAPSDATNYNAIAAHGWTVTHN